MKVLEKYIYLKNKTILKEICQKNINKTFFKLIKNKNQFKITPQQKSIHDGHFRYAC